MYHEQSAYYSLMQDCLQQIPNIPWTTKFFSYLYGLFSDYGQSITRPILSFILILFLSIGLYNCIGISLNESVYASLTQIVKPFSIVYDANLARQLLQNQSEHNERTHTINECLLSSSVHIQQKNFLALTDKKFEEWLLIIISIVESLAELTLLFLFGLALRWNYRKA
jgi:uncharacterized membrane protein